MSETPTILPHNASDIEIDLEHLSDRQQQFAATTKTLWNPDTCPASILPWLAWAFSVDEWDPNWSDDAKRATIRDAVSVHRLKGTIGSVKAALASAGYGDAEVIERFGWEFHDGTNLRNGSINRVRGDQWAEYRVVLTRPITVEQASQVRKILEEIAPTRSHLKALQYPEAQNLHNNKIIRNGVYTRGTA